jgi:RHS repeat-associated protein
VRQVVDPAGSVTLAQSYDPFGNLLTSAGTGSSVFGYTGEQVDASTGLVYLRARYYQSAVGRFTGQDPFPGYANRPQTLNPYLYVTDNPATLIDPTGQQGSGGRDEIVNRIIRKDSSGHVHGGFDSLIKLFETDELNPYDPPASNTARARLELVLNITNKPTAGVDVGNQFAIDFTTCGLREEYNDEWLYRRYWKQNPDDPNVGNQVGHFLTAVHLGYNPSFLALDNSLGGIRSLFQPSLYARQILNVPTDEPLDVTAKRLIVGHEKVADPDPANNSIEDTGRNVNNYRPQYQSATAIDVGWFDAAVQYDRSGDTLGTVWALAKILVSPRPQDWGRGNSLQDLRLSLKGWRLGRAVAGKDVDQGEKTLTSRGEIATWLRMQILIPGY